MCWKLAIVLLLTKTWMVAADPVSNGGKHVKIVGSVFCDTCSEQQFTKNSYFISGATVAVECRIKKPARLIRIEGKTNEYGEFGVELPSSNFYSGRTQLGRRCSVRLLANSEGSCKRASIAKSSSLALKSNKGGICTYSAGALSYRPRSPPSWCSKSKAAQSSLQSSKSNSGLTFPFPGLPSLFPSPPPPPPSPPTVLPIPPFPTTPLLPPLPFLTPPPPPPLFGIPPIPFLQPPPPSILPPGIPFLNPPPSILPPGIPFLNPPPIIPLPPNPFQPPPLIPPNPILPPPVIPLPPLPPNPFVPPPLIPLPPLPPNPLRSPPPLAPLQSNSLQRPPLPRIPPASINPPSVSTP